MTLPERLLIGGRITVSCRCLFRNEKGKRGWVMEPHQVTGGLLLCCCGWSLPLLSARTNWIISSELKLLLPLSLQSFSLSAPFFTSISPSLLPSFTLLPAPRPQTAWLNTQANVSLFKETQVVDMLAMGQDQNEELL